MTNSFKLKPLSPLTVSAEAVAEALPLPREEEEEGTKEVEEEAERERLAMPAKLGTEYVLLSPGFSLSLSGTLGSDFGSE